MNYLPAIIDWQALLWIQACELLAWLRDMAFFALKLVLVVFLLQRALKFFWEMKDAKTKW